MEKKLRSIVVEICNRALKGQISLEEFFEKWPQNILGEQFYLLLYEDLEEGIEHTPGFFLRKGVDLKAWRKSYYYLKIYLDSLLLGFDKECDELMQCRRYVLNEKKLSEEIIKKKVDEFFMHS